MFVQSVVRVVYRKVFALPYLLCILFASASPVLATSSTALHAEYPPGQIRLTPEDRPPPRTDVGGGTPRPHAQPPARL